MLFAIGTKVRLTQSGETGVITERIDDSMVKVYLQEMDMEIPLLLEHLERIGAPKSTSPQASPQVPAEAHQPQYGILRSQGIQLAFVPDTWEGIIRYFKAYLINDTAYDFLFQLQIQRPDSIDTSGKLEAMSYHFLGTLPFAALSDKPQLRVSGHRLTTAGKGPEQSFRSHLKPKTFFRNRRTVPIMEQRAYWFSIFKNWAATSADQPKTESDLREYTRQQQQAIQHNPRLRRWQGRDLQAYAAFDRELDLHVENLTTDPGKLDGRQKYELQIRKFETYLAKAIELGIPSVFIIHGLGRGKLREAIHNRLQKHPYVQDFVNEHHPRYGFGATEVFFG